MTDANAMGRDLLKALDDLSGVHPGYRAAHAKGTMLTGAFTPAREAASLTRAPHAGRASTPVTVRFSNSAGIPTVADNAPNGASPRGIAIRFHLAPHAHTDIIGHSTDGFPVRTPEEFLEFLRAAHAGPSAIGSFLGSHPTAKRFIDTPKPIPTSFAREAFFGVNAFKFTNRDGAVRHGRFRIRPGAGTEHLADAAASAKSANFLFDEIAARVVKGPVTFHLAVQLANPGDVVDDATAHWPEDRPQLEFGTLALTRRVADDDAEARRIIFDPIPRVDGIESAGDPLLEPRAAVYLLSGRRRRAAGAK
jgi:catalase